MNVQRAVAVRGLCVAALAAVVLTAWGQESGKSLTADPNYEKQCAKCHGKTAEGRMMGGPSLVSDKVTGAPAEQLKDRITNGKGHMPKFAGKLSAEEIDALVKEIQAGKKG